MYICVSLLLGAVAALLFVWAVDLRAVPAEYSTVTPIRHVDDTLPPTLRDLARHLPPVDLMRARAGDDMITWAHESHHFVNSRLSNARVRGFYLLDNSVWRFPNPTVTRLKDVAEAIPEELRGQVYKTYLIDSQRDWNNIPIYMFDEALAYWTGAMVRQEIGRADRQETERFGVELTVYAMYAVKEMCRLEGDDYPKQELMDFLDLVVARARVICPEFDNQPHAKALALLGRGVEVADAEAE